MPKKRRSAKQAQSAARSRWGKEKESHHPTPSTAVETTTATIPSTPSTSYIPPPSTLSTSGISPPSTHSTIPPPSTPSTSYILPPSTPSTSGIPAPSTPSISGIPPPSTPSTYILPPSTPSTSYILPPSTPSTSYILPPSTPSTSGIPAPSTPSTSSAKKMKLYKKYHGTARRSSDCHRTIVEIGQISNLLKNVCCPFCFKEGLDIYTTNQYGMAIKMNAFCTTCNQTVSSQYTSRRNRKSPSTPKPFVINEISSMSALLSGMGAYRFRNFCEYMDMPGLHQKTFNSIAKRIYSQNEAVGSEIFNKAAHIVRQEYARHYCLSVDDDTIVDIDVSYDGSWLTRGHKSLIGLGSVIDALTGLILDAHVTSLYCQECTQTGEWIRRENPQRFDRWKNAHLASGQCLVNFEGTSAMMEVKIAEVLWGRSLERHKLRYRTMVSDGDSKAYNRVVELKPYGEDTIIDKEDCLNHVGKRLGTALRNVVSDCSKKGVTLGGKGHGRLTAETIRKLQIYYSRAIRRESSAAGMKKAILASIFHGYSTDDFPQHMYCPSGTDSWCFYKRAMGEHHYPTGHKKRVHTPLDQGRLHKYIWPVYSRLTSDELLRRCERKATQNPNESFHHSVWSKCSKTTFHSLKRVQFAVISAAAEYNSGPEVISELKELCGFETGTYGHKLAATRKQQRLFRSERMSTERAKKRRKKRAEAREKARQEKEAEEGGPAYQAGAF